MFLLLFACSPAFTIGTFEGVRPDGTAWEAEETWTFDREERPLRRTLHEPTLGELQIDWFYGEHDHPLRWITIDNGWSVERRYTLDNQGRPTFMREFSSDPGPNQRWEYGDSLVHTIEQDERTETVYDDRGRPLTRQLWVWIGSGFNESLYEEWTWTGDEGHRQGWLSGDHLYVQSWETRDEQDRVVAYEEHDEWGLRQRHAYVYEGDRLVEVDERWFSAGEPGATIHRALIWDDHGLVTVEGQTTSTQGTATWTETWTGDHRALVETETRWF